MTTIHELIKRRPVASYFTLTFAISWVGSLLAAGPAFARGEALQPGAFALMLLAMLVGPAFSGVVLTWIVDGTEGLRDLLVRMGRWRVGVPWYAVALLLPPVLILGVHLAFALLLSPAFMPALLAVGLAYGLLAGFFEEIGWMGYAFPKMQRQRDALSAGVLLGVLWGLWHAVAGYLGTAEQLGSYWLPHYLALWIAGMTAMRVLIAWVYVNTRSVLLCQVMHASSTGFVALLAPAALSPAQETLWYAVYAIVLWGAVVAVVASYGRRLTWLSAAAQATK